MLSAYCWGVPAFLPSQLKSEFIVTSFDALCDLWRLSNGQTRCEVPAQLLRSANAPRSARSPRRLCQTRESSGSRLATQDSARRSPRRCSLCTSKLSLIGKTNLLCSTCRHAKTPGDTHPPALCHRCCCLFGAPPDKQRCQVLSERRFTAAFLLRRVQGAPGRPFPVVGCPSSSSGSRLLQIPLPSEECVLLYSGNCSQGSPFSRVCVSIPLLPGEQLTWSRIVYMPSSVTVSVV